MTTQINKLKEIVDYLNNLTEEKDWLNLTAEKCQEALLNLKKEGDETLKEIDLEKVIIKDKSNSIVFSNEVLDYPYFSIIQDISIMNDLEEEQIGNYKLIIDLSGNLVDDYLVIY